MNKTLLWIATALAIIAIAVIMWGIISGMTFIPSNNIHTTENIQLPTI